MKQQLLEIWHSRAFQIGMDICRILLVIISIMIFYKLVTEIEAVKMLNYDPCELCMNKTGATCFYLSDLSSIQAGKDKIDMLVNLTNVNLTHIFQYPAK